MSRGPQPPASRLAAVGAALSLVAATASAPVAHAADAIAAPVSPATTAAQSAKAPPPKASAGTPANPPALPPALPPAKAPPAAPDEAAVDDDLLEFLGSIGDTTEEGDWLDFLSNTDIDKVAKRGSKTPARDR